MSASQLAISALQKENEENYHAHGKSKLTAFLVCVTSVLRNSGPPKTKETNHAIKKFWNWETQRIVQLNFFIVIG